MFDISQSEDYFGYIHTEGGQIASIGTLCKVTNRQLLDDGRQFIELEGVGRFRVRKIVRTLPVSFRVYIVYIVIIMYLSCTDTRAYFQAQMSSST